MSMNRELTSQLMQHLQRQARPLSAPDLARQLNVSKVAVVNKILYGLQREGKVFSRTEVGSSKPLWYAQTVTLPTCISTTIPSVHKIISSSPPNARAVTLSETDYKKKDTSLRLTEEEQQRYYATATRLQDALLLEAKRDADINKRLSVVRLAGSLPQDLAIKDSDIDFVVVVKSLEGEEWIKNRESMLKFVRDFCAKHKQNVTLLRDQQPNRNASITIRYDDIEFDILLAFQPGPGKGPVDENIMRLGLALKLLKSYRLSDMIIKDAADDLAMPLKELLRDKEKLGGEHSEPVLRLACDLVNTCISSQQDVIKSSARILKKWFKHWWAKSQSQDLQPDRKLYLFPNYALTVLTIWLYHHKHKDIQSSVKLLTTYVLRFLARYLRDDDPYSPRADIYVPKEMHGYIDKLTPREKEERFLIRDVFNDARNILDKWVSVDNRSGDRRRFMQQAVQAALGPEGSESVSLEFAEFILSVPTAPEAANAPPQLPLGAKTARPVPPAAAPWPVQGARAVENGSTKPTASNAVAALSRTLPSPASFLRCQLCNKLCRGDGDVKSHEESKVHQKKLAAAARAADTNLRIWTAA
eukprot:g17264.t1